MTPIHISGAMQVCEEDQEHSTCDKSDKNGQGDERRVQNNVPSFVMAPSSSPRHKDGLGETRWRSDQSSLSERCTPLIGAAIWC